MQNRYTGDIGDFGKLGLLRQLSRTGLSIGVNWYLTPDETHNGDRRHIGYLKNDAFRACDEQLWSVLGQIVGSGKRQVSALERPDILQASFYSRVLDFTCADKMERQMLRWEWHNRAMQQLQNCDIIFADPDNGMIVPSADGTPKSNKFVLPFELSSIIALVPVWSIISTRRGGRTSSTSNRIINLWNLADFSVQRVSA